MSKLEQLFWEQVEPQGECLVWTGSKEVRGGYGRFRRLGVDIKAHRFAYSLVYDELPPLLRHICDNPPCVNVDHLIPGTHQDNTDDMITRGRMIKKDLKFSKKQEESVCKDRLAGLSYRALARKHQTSFGHIQWIMRRGGLN